MKKFILTVYTFLLITIMAFCGGMQSKLDEINPSMVLLKLFDIKQNVECSYGENAIDIKLTKAMSDDTKLKYTLYNEVFNTQAKGVLTESPLHCPYGTQICFWVEYEDGIKTRAKSFLISEKKEFPIIEVISPQSGIWNEPQTLKINFTEGAEVFYSVDGSDPEKQGMMYTKPILIDRTGNINLRVKAINSTGQILEKYIEYKVKKKEQNSLDANKIQTSGDLEIADRQLFVPYSVLDWNFFEFYFQKPVYYTILNNTEEPINFEKSYKNYDGPFFIDRTKDTYIFWSCESFKNGKIQKIVLPAKPILLGIPKKQITNKTVELQFSDSRYSYYFENSDAFFPAEPSVYSSKFDGTKQIFHILPNHKQEFNLRIKAFYKGLPQGDFFVNFTIDKLKPPKPKLKYSTTDNYSNRPVKITLPEKNDNYNLIIDINPPAVEKNRRALILTGSSDGNIDYTIEAYYQDKAGNKSEIEKKQITIGMYSIYVDKKFGSKTGAGTKNKPFLEIEDAVNYIQELAGKEKNPDALPIWSIYLIGKFKISEPLLITNNIELKGQQNTNIELLTNVGFVVENCIFKISNCYIIRKEHKDEPREVPVIYSSNSSVALNNSVINATNGGAIIKTFNSHLESSNSIIESNQTNNCLVINLKKSSAIIDSTKITAKGNSVVVISAIESDLEISSFNCILYPECVSRAIEGWNSKLLIENLVCTRKPINAFNFDTCIWYDKKSSLNLIKPAEIIGFKKNEQQH